MSRMRIDGAQGRRCGNEGVRGGVSPAHRQSLTLSFVRAFGRTPFPCFRFPTSQFLIDSGLRIEIAATATKQRTGHVSNR